MQLGQDRGARGHNKDTADRPQNIPVDLQSGSSVIGHVCGGAAKSGQVQELAFEAGRHSNAPKLRHIQHIPRQSEPERDH